jgi:hypothetical protein
MFNPLATPFGPLNQTKPKTEVSTMSLISLLSEDISITTTLTLGKPGNTNLTSTLLDNGELLDNWLVSSFKVGSQFSFGVDILGPWEIMGDLTVRGFFGITRIGPIPPGGLLNPPAGNLSIAADLVTEGTSNLQGKATAATSVVVGDNITGITLGDGTGNIAAAGDLDAGLRPAASTTSVRFGGFNAAGLDGGITNVTIGDNLGTTSVNVPLTINNHLEMSNNAFNLTVTGGTGHFAGGINATINPNSGVQLIAVDVTANPGDISTGDTLILTYAAVTSTTLGFAFGRAAAQGPTQCVEDPLPLVVSDGTNVTITFQANPTDQNPQYIILLI